MSFLEVKYAIFLNFKGGGRSRSSIKLLNMWFAHSVPSLTINLLTVYVKVAIRFDLALFAVMGRWPVWKTSTVVEW